MRRWAIAGGVALLLAAAAVVAALRLGGRWEAELAEAALEAAGIGAVVGDAEVHPLAGAARLRGVVLDVPGARLAVDEIGVAAGLDAGMRPVLRRLELVRPTLRVDLDAVEVPGGQLGEGGPARRWWREVVVRDGAVRLVSGDLEVEARGVALEPEGARHRLRIARLALARGSWRREARDIDVAGVDLAADGVVLPPFAIELGRVAIGGRLDARGGRVAALLSAHGPLDELDGLLGPGVAVRGDGAVDLEADGPLRAPELRGALRVAGLAVRPSEGAGWIELGDVAGEWRWAGRRLLLDPLRLDWAGGRGGLALAVDPATTGFRVDGTLEDVRLARALRALAVHGSAWVDVRLDAEAHFAGTLLPLRLSGSAEVAAADLVVRAGPAEDPAPEAVLAVPAVSLSTEVDVAGGLLEFHVRDLVTARSRGRVDARIGLSRRGGLDIAADLAPLDLGELRPLGGLDLDGRVRLRGRLSGPWSRLRASGTAEGTGIRLEGLPLADALEAEWSSDLRGIALDRFRARLGRSRASGALAVDFVPDTRIDLQVLLPEARVADLLRVGLVDLPGVDGRSEGTLELSGPPDALDGEARLELGRVELFGERFSEGRAVAVMRRGRFTLEEAIVRRPGEALFARGTVGPGWALAGEVRSSGLRVERLARLADLPLSGRLVLDAQLSGTLLEPEVSGRVALRRARWAGHPLGDSTLRFETRDRELVARGELVGPDLHVSGRIGLDAPHAFELAAEARGLDLAQFHPRAADGRPVAAHLDGALTLRGAAGRPVDLDARVDALALSWGGRSAAAPGPWRLRLHGGDARLEGVALRGDGVDLSFEASERGGRWTARGGGEVDLAWLPAVVEGVQAAGGRARVEVDTERRGAPVRARLDGARLRLEWLPEVLEEVSGRVEAGPSGYAFEEVHGRLGGGTWSGGGRIEAEGWVPRRYDLRGAVRGARVRWFDFLPPLEGDADLAFDGPVGELLLSGQVRVRRMAFTDRIDWESWLLELTEGPLDEAVEEEGGDWFDLDVEVVADRAIRMRNNVADLDASARLRFVGNTARVGLVGTIRAEPGGRVLVKERSFELLRGEVLFADPWSYDPELDIAMRTRVEGRDRTWEIEYRVRGTYSDWRAESSSQPPLPEADINALLLFGMTRAELERTGGLGGALALEGTDLLASRLGLDVVDRAPGVLRPDRIDLVTGSTARGSRSISSELRLIVEKDLSRRWTAIAEQTVPDFAGTYLGLEHRIARRLALRGYWTDEQQGRSLPGGAWGLDFDLRWEVD